VIVKERVRLDTEWAAFMIAKGWLKVGLAAGIITLYAYPGTPIILREYRVERVDRQ